MSAQYVGYGDLSSCITNAIIGPGFVSTSSSYLGAIMSCGSLIYKNDQTNAYYLGNHPDLVWVKANSTTVGRIYGKVFHSYWQFQMAYGRILVNNLYQLGEKSLAKSSNNRKDFYFY